jgi:large subunit ribosomal protein L35
MPKLKSHRGAKKRFKRTGTGKVMRTKAFRRHILTSKPKRRKRHMRGMQVVAAADARRLKRMLPYD